MAALQSKELKRKWRVLAYTIALMRAVRDLRPSFVDLDLDGAPAWSGAVYQVSVGNGRYHGGGLLIAENAAIDDGKLDLYLVYPGRFWQLVASLTYLTKPEVLKRLTAITVALRSDRSWRVNVDGELATKTPAKFEMRPKALTVMVPSALPLNHLDLSRPS